MMLAILFLAAADTARLPEPANYSSIGWLVVSLAALAGAANQIDDFFSRRKGKPPAGELQIAAIGLQERVERLEHNYENISEQLATTRTALMEDESERRRAIYAKIDELRIETKEDIASLRTELTGELRQYNQANEQRVSAIHDRISAVLSAVSEVRGKMQ